MSKREKIIELLQDQRINLEGGVTLTLSFQGSPDYVKQTIYTEAKKLLNFPISVTAIDNGLQIKRRTDADFNINITAQAAQTSRRSLDPSLDPNDLD